MVPLHHLLDPWEVSKTAERAPRRGAKGGGTADVTDNLPEPRGLGRRRKADEAHPTRSATADPAGPGHEDTTRAGTTTAQRLEARVSAALPPRVTAGSETGTSPGNPRGWCGTSPCSLMEKAPPELHRPQIGPTRSAGDAHTFKSIGRGEIDVLQRQVARRRDPRS
jgi:hypothetical protein